MNELAKPESFQDIIRDKVRKLIIETVPDEQINMLIKKEFDSFFTDYKKTPYDRDTSPSPFKQLVQEQLKTFFNEKIQVYVHTHCQDFWNDEAQGMRLTKEMTEALAPSALRSLTTEIVARSMQALRQSL